MIDTKRKHTRYVRNEPYVFLAYDWHEEDAHA